MTAPAPSGAPRTDLRDCDRANNAQEATVGRAQIQEARAAVKATTGISMKATMIRRIYDYWQAQARAEAGFVEWLLDYADPTGETATDNILWQHAKEVAA